MKNSPLHETQLLVYSIGLFISSVGERLITNLINDQLGLFDNYPIFYHLLSLVTLIGLFIFTNGLIKSIINMEWVKRWVFGDKFVGGHWVEICTNAETNEASHYTYMKIGYDTDKIYLSGPVYNKNYIWIYNLEMVSLATSLENNTLPYFFKCDSGEKNWEGYGKTVFVKRENSKPNRFVGRYVSGDGVTFNVKGYLITDKSVLKKLKDDFLPTFREITTRLKDEERKYRSNEDQQDAA